MTLTMVESPVKKAIGRNLTVAVADVDDDDNILDLGNISSDEN